MTTPQKTTTYRSLALVALLVGISAACTNHADKEPYIDPYPKPDLQLDADVPIDLSDTDPACSALPLHPANPKSPYKDVLARCLTTTDPNHLCPLNTLPYLGQTTSAPTIDNIMDRVVVSDDWMAIEFRRLLETLVSEARDPKLLLHMFRAITGIVIAADLSPGAYDERSGAFCVNPLNIWLTRTEFNTIHEPPDIRSMYTDQMQFRPDGWSYLKQELQAYNEGFPNQDRTTEDAKYQLAYLMVHELTHAYDAYSAYDFKTLKGDENPFQLENLHQVKDSASFRLNQMFPLSNRLKGLAQVFFLDKMPTDHQKSYPAEAVAAEFLPQSAPLLYSATTQFEYAATLDEEFMMFYQFGVDQDVIFYDRVGKQVLRQRRRIAAPQMREPLRLVLSQLYPEFSFDLSILGDVTTER